MAELTNKECSVEGCSNPSRSAGLCTKHYGRKMRHGDPLYVNPRKTYGTALERFKSKVLITEGCHIWTGAKNKDGYGCFRSEYKTAHRFIYFHHNPDADKTLSVMHSCDNPACVNIEHLSLGSHKENMNDRDSKGRCRKGERSGVSKLTEREVKAIKEDERTIREIADCFGVSSSHVSMIKMGKTWRHLNEVA